MVLQECFRDHREVVCEPLFEEDTKICSMINIRLVRMFRIYKPRMRVSEYNALINRISNDVSGNPRSTAKALMIPHHHKSLVVIDHKYGTLTSATAKNGVLRWEAFRRLENIREARRRREEEEHEAENAAAELEFRTCPICKEVASHKTAEMRHKRRKLSLNGSRIRGRNRVTKYYGTGSFCKKCYPLALEKLRHDGEIEDIRKQAACLLREIKRN